MKKSIPITITVILLAAACIAAAAFCIRPAKAKIANAAGIGETAAEPPRVLTVIGEGEYTTDADGAAYCGGISAIADSAGEAERRCEELLGKIRDAFSPYGKTIVTGRSAYGASGEKRAYIACRFELNDISGADEARTVLIGAGAENVGNCEYYESSASGKAEALKLALDDAREKAGALGGGKSAGAEELYCYADGFGENGKVTYRAGVRVIFVTHGSRPHECRKPEKQPRQNDGRNIVIIEK